MNLQRRASLLAVLILAGPALTACDDTTGPQSAAPNVTIEAPSEQFSYQEGEAITFRGSANDPEDGPVPPGQLLWLSDVDGALGNGNEITVSNLSPTGHEVFLIAQDSDGVRGSASVGIVVRADPQSVADRGR